jgi:hypothetical protein
MGGEGAGGGVGGGFGGEGVSGDLCLSWLSSSLVHLAFFVASYTLAITCQWHMLISTVV